MYAPHAVVFSRSLPCALVAVLALLTAGAVPTVAAAPWNTEIVDAAGDTGRYTSCKVDAAGTVHVAYKDVSNGMLRYAVKPGAYWSPVETPDFGLNRGDWASLALSATGEPRISYVADPISFSSTLRYATKSGVVWSSELAFSYVFVGETGTSLALTSTGVPFIATYGLEPFITNSEELWLSNKSGATWTNNQIEYSQVPYSCQVPSLAIDGTGAWHLAYRQWKFGTGAYWLAYRTSTSFFPEYITSQAATSTSIAVDASNVPHIAYTEGFTGGILRYAFKTGTFWTVETVDASSSKLQSCSIALDTAGRPHIAYSDSTTGNLKYASRSGPGVWTIETVDALGTVGQYASLALDSSNRPHITYYDATNGNLKHAWQEQVLCPNPTACTTPPSLMKAWWPFNELLGQAVNIASPAFGLTNAVLLGGASRVPGIVGSALQCISSAQYASVANNALLDVGAGDFSIDAWVNASATSSSTVRSIVDKRGGSNLCALGYAFFLYNGVPSLQMGDASCHANFIPASPNVADGQWHHVAVTVQRGSPTGGRMWVDGVNTATFDPTTRPASLDNSGPFLIGQRQTFSSPESFDGKIDEVEVWKRVIAPTEILALWQAGGGGKCTETCYVPSSLTFATQTSTVTGQATIWNYSAIPQTYTWVLAPVPVTGACNTPTTAPNLSGGPVTIQPGASFPIGYTVPFPAGLTVGNAACYQLTVTNTVTGACFGCLGHLRLACCLVPSGWSLTSLSEGSTSDIRFPVSNPGKAAVSAHYSFAERPADGNPVNRVLVLNGLAPGGVLEGDVFVPAGRSAEIPLSVTAKEHDPFSVHDVVFSLLSKDGTTFDEVGVMPLQTTVAGATGVPPVAERLLDGLLVRMDRASGKTEIQFGLSAPGDVRVSVLDVTGRLVRTIEAGHVPAGAGRVVWDGRDAQGHIAPSGLFLVRVDVGGCTQTRKVIVVW